MASVNGLNRLGLPKLSENMDPEDARALRSYLYQMQEQLQYVLTNLDVENLSEELRTAAMTPAAWKTDSRWKRPWQGPVTAPARA